MLGQTCFKVTQRPRIGRYKPQSDGLLIAQEGQKEIGLTRRRDEKLGTQREYAREQLDGCEGIPARNHGMRLLRPHTQQLQFGGLLFLVRNLHVTRKRFLSEVEPIVNHEGYCNHDTTPSVSSFFDETTITVLMGTDRTPV